MVPLILGNPHIGVVNSKEVRVEHLQLSRCQGQSFPQYFANPIPKVLGSRVLGFRVWGLGFWVLGLRAE